MPSRRRTRQSRQQKGGGALHIAIANKDKAQFDRLIAEGADINQTNKFGFTPLMLSILEFNNDLYFFNKLVEIGVNVNVDANGYTALKIAISKELIVIIKRLLEFPEIDVSSSHGKLTPLMTAAMHGTVEILQLLLEYPGIQINGTGELGNNALMMTIQHPNKSTGLKMARTLISAGIDIHVKNRAGQTALIIAAYYGNNPIVQLLLNAGADINVQDNNGSTALMEAIRNNKNTVIQTLIARPELQINLQNNGGTTALMLASQFLGIQLFRRVLVTPGINIHLRNNGGESALSVAVYHGNDRIADALRAAGAVMERPIPVQRHGIAMEIHDQFAKVKVPEFIAYMKQLVGDREIPTNMTMYIKTRLNSFVTGDIETVQAKLNAVYERHLNAMTFSQTEKTLFFFVLEYVASKDPFFQQNYVAAFAHDCAEAYNEGNRMSCAKGVKERLVLSLESAFGSVDMIPEYRKVLHLLDPTKYPDSNSDPIDYIRWFNQFGSVCMGSGTTKVAFVECMKTKMREQLGTLYNKESVSIALDQYMRDGVGNNAFTGGRRKRTLRKTKHRKHIQHIPTKFL